MSSMETTGKPTTLGDAVRTVFSKYATFSGRAARPEYWYFVLFAVICSIVLAFVDAFILGMENFQPLSTLFSLAVLLPSLGVLARRLHDTDRTAWWILIGLVPIIGTIVLIIFAIQQGTPGANRFGPPPA